MKYWGFYLPKHISRFAEVNAPLSNKIKEDIRRWNSVSFLTLRIDCVKMNILLLYLYLFQVLPMEITQKEFSAINNLTRILKKDGKRKETSQYQMKNGWMHVNPCGVEMYKFQYMAPKQMAHLDIGALKCWRMCREREAGHWHIFWDCLKIKPFCLKFHKASITVFKVNNIPLQFYTIFLLNLNHLQGIVNNYLFTILETAAKKAVTRCWLLPRPPL